MDIGLQRYRFLDVLTGDPHGKHLFAHFKDSDDKKQLTHLWGTILELGEELERVQQEGHGVFVLINTTVNPPRRRKEDICEINAVWLDIDGTDKVPKFPVEPTMVVRTKNGHHVYFVLDKPSMEVKWGERFNKMLSENYGGDPGAKDISRVLRMPGFLHLKSDPFMVELKRFSYDRYSVDELEKAFNAAEPSVERPETESNMGTADGLQGSPMGLAAALDEEGRIRSTGKGGRNNQINLSGYNLGQLVASGDLSERTAMFHILRGARGCGISDEEARQAAGSGLQAGKRNPREVAVKKKASGIIDVRGGAVERLTSEIDRRIAVGYESIEGPMRMLNACLGGGLPAGAVTLLGAPPGMGKSSLALEWGMMCSVTDRPVLFCSLELSEIDLYARMTTLRMGLPWIAVRQGKHRDELLDTIQSTLETKLYVTTRHQCNGIGQVREYVDELNQEYGKPPMVIIDYLQLLMPAGDMREPRTVMADISGGVAHCAQDTGAPILCVTAINRQSYNSLNQETGRPDRYVALSAAKESGRLEYDAEVIMGMQLGGVVSGGQYGWVCVAKNRSGGAAADVGCHYDGMSGKFRDAEHDEVFQAAAEERRMTKASQLTGIKDRIMEVIDGPMTYKSVEGLHDAVGGGRNKVREAVKDLMSKGMLFKNANDEFVRKEW